MENDKKLIANLKQVLIWKEELWDIVTETVKKINNDPTGVSAEELGENINKKTASILIDCFKLVIETPELLNFFEKE